MITINTLQVSSDRLNLSVGITTDTGVTFQSVKLWTEDTYKDYTKTIDLSNKLSSSTNVESFTIESSDINATQFDGLYFIEFTDSNNVSQISAVAELTTYKKCLLDKTLEILGSDINVIKGEGCNNSEFNKLIYIHSILNALQSAIISGYYSEAINFINTLKKFCSKCSDCPSLSSILSLGTLNNNIIII